MASVTVNVRTDDTLARLSLYFFPAATPASVELLAATWTAGPNAREALDS